LRCAAAEHPAGAGALGRASWTLARSRAYIRRQSVSLLEEKPPTAVTQHRPLPRRGKGKRAARESLTRARGAVAHARLI